MTVVSDNTPSQLALPIQLRASSVFSSYHAGPNAEVITRLTDLSQLGPGPVVFLYGPTGSGKSHLLQALCARAGIQQQSAAYLPMRELQAYGVELLAGAEQMALVCIDDAASVLQLADWNQALFNLYRELDERGGKLLIAAEHSPTSMRLPLRDLSSRVLAGTLLRLQPLPETDMIAALQLHALQRGLELPDEVANFLLRRLPRDMHSLCGFVDTLDVASLVAQRRLTVPFVRQVLAQRST